MSTLKQVKYPLCVCFIFTFKCSPASGHEGQKAMAKKKKKSVPQLSEPFLLGMQLMSFLDPH